MEIITNLDINTSTVLEQALLLVQDWLSIFASNPEFSQKMALAFGDSYDAGILESLRQQLVAGDFSALPKIEVRTRDELNGANGAFSLDNNIIYLAQEYLVEN